MSAVILTRAPSLSYDVCVVGAGFAGLSCALALLDARPGLRIVVLEAGDKVGGRTETRDGPVGPYDAGAQWVSRAHARVLALAQRFGVETIEQQWPAGLAAVAPPDADSRLGWLDWFGSDNESVQDFMDRWPASMFMDSASKEELTLLVRRFLACEPREVSPKYLRWSIKVCGGVTAVSDGPDGAQALYFRQGAGALAQRIADHLVTRGCAVRASTPVARVEVTEGKTCAVTTEAGERIDAHAVVVAATPPQWARIVKDISHIPKALSRGMFMGRAVKTIAVYTRPVWEGAAPRSAPGPVSEVFTSSSSGTHTVTGIIVADEARRLAGATRQDIERVVSDQYAAMFNTSDRPTFFDCADWSKNPRIRGCFSAVPRPGVLSELQAAEGYIADGSIVYACTEIARDWASYMEGAVSSGQDAAVCLGHLLA